MSEGEFVPTRIRASNLRRNCWAGAIGIGEAVLDQGIGHECWQWCRIESIFGYFDEARLFVWTSIFRDRFRRQLGRGILCIENQLLDITGYLE